MKVSCLQHDLQHSLSQVSRAVATRTSMPALSNVLLATDDGRLKIAASDLDMSVTTWLNATVEDEGKLAVDARLLIDFVSTLPLETVELESEPNRFRVDVRCGRDHAEINGVDPDDFPEIPTVSGDSTTIELDPAEFREMIVQVEFAASADEARPALSGLLVRFDQDRLTLAAADGFRLAVRHGTLDQLVPDRLDVIVPVKAMRELARLISEATETVALHVTPNQGQIIARFGNVEFVSRLIEGTFPDFNQIIPIECSTTVELGSDSLLTAVKRSGFFARDNNDAVRLNVQASENELEPGLVEVSANAAERGNSQSFVDASISGPSVEVAFNSKYLNDVLGVMKADRAILGLNGSNQAGVVRTSGSDEYTHVIMPMVIGAT